MPLTLIRHATQKPPIGPLKLDLGHPLALGLKGLVVLNEFGSNSLFETVTASALVLQGGATWSSKNGKTGLLTNAAGAMATIATPSSLQISLPISIVWSGAYLGGESQHAHVFGVSYANNDSGQFECYDFSFDTISGLRLEWNNGSFQNTGNGFPSIGPVWMGGTLAAGAQAFYMNDPLTAAATSSVAGGGVTYGSTTQLTLGGYTGTARNAAVLHEVGHIYNRILSTGELAWLKAEPYCMVQTRPLQRWFTVAAASANPYLSPRDPIYVQRRL